MLYVKDNVKALQGRLMIDKGKKTDGGEGVTWHEKSVIYQRMGKPRKTTKPHTHPSRRRRE
ncbi:MAG: hypothetical protein MZV63_15725 [Marinilabiliales bacterium]|nr:hypothetical protein [Marinilabiliales bacterium]